MTRNVIVAEDLVKKYEGRKVVLDHVSFSIREGEFVTVYGKSGCGKTTLLNILGGLDRPTAGDVRIDGESLVEMSENQLADLRVRKIGFVFQDFNLLPDMTVRDNIALPLRFSRKKDKEVVENLIRMFDIEDVADEMANRISGGEAQRTALARALVNKPSIILADEPTGNLDIENSINVMESLDRVVRELGTTVVLATHDMELGKYSTFRIMLRDGKAVCENAKHE